jgi:ribosome maturation factor RimP
VQEEDPMQSLQTALTQLINRDVVTWLNHHDLKVINGRLIAVQTEHIVLKSGEHTFFIPFNAIVAARSA